jgi:hypothetical protein
MAKMMGGEVLTTLKMCERSICGLRIASQTQQDIGVTF